MNKEISSCCRVYRQPNDSHSILSIYTECVQVGEIFLGAMLFGRTAPILHEKLNGLFSEARTNAANLTGSFDRAERMVRAMERPVRRDHLVKQVS